MEVFWRLLTSKIAFLDVKDIALCSMLIYNFRFLERRFGSRKFVSYLIATSVLSTALELAVLVICHQFDVSFGTMPSGPFCLVFPQFAQFFLKIPRVAVSSIMGVPVTGKTFTYILGLQVASASPESRLVTSCALAAGFLWHHNFLKIQSIIWIPESVSSQFDRMIGWLFKSPPPANLNTPMGATLELQRQERLERVEEQMIAAAMQNSVAHNGTYNLMRPQPVNVAHGPGVFGNFVRHDGLRHRDHSSGDQSPDHSSAITVSEDQVQRLTEMGFSDDSVRRALVLSNNDISRATNILLQDST
ncbi:hypothetical protein C0Q70_21080 [Pomacea canaliculata]|uniref:UBA domain-containing protein n=1 Tax=Pomacea canaliculata TaxID=400727 RepID=A0A2T7NBJ2_POMCA|nr:hypothetical protein C0Q70_21080 [Pomacea canaliculata]